VRQGLENLAGAARVAAIAAGDGDARTSGAARFVIESAPGHDLRRRLFILARDRQWVLLELQREIVRLEDVFRQLTTGPDTAAGGRSAK